MTRRAYQTERQAVYRWRSNLESALARVDELLARRPWDARYGKLPKLPDRVLHEWDLKYADDNKPSG